MVHSQYDPGYSYSDPASSQSNLVHCQSEMRGFTFWILKGDLTEVYKIIRGIDKVNSKGLFPKMGLFSQSYLLQRKQPELIQPLLITEMFHPGQHPGETLLYSLQCTHILPR
eukprot:g35518.t1